MGLKFLTASGSGNTADAIECIQFAIQAKQIFGAGANVRVLSNSWGGGGFSQALLDAINAANNADMLFVAAAGNSNSNNDTTANYPSNYNVPNVLAVAATDNRDNKSSFSSFGATTVDLGSARHGHLFDRAQWRLRQLSAEPRWPPRMSQARRRWCSPDVI